MASQRALKVDGDQEKVFVKSNSFFKRATSAPVEVLGLGDPGLFRQHGSMKNLVRSGSSLKSADALPVVLDRANSLKMGMREPTLYFAPYGVNKYSQLDPFILFENAIRRELMDLHALLSYANRPHVNLDAPFPDMTSRIRNWLCEFQGFFNLYMETETNILMPDVLGKDTLNLPNKIMLMMKDELRIRSKRVDSFLSIKERDFKASLKPLLVILDEYSFLIMSYFKEMERFLIENTKLDSNAQLTNIRVERKIFKAVMKSRNPKLYTVLLLRWNTNWGRLTPHEREMWMRNRFNPRARFSVSTWLATFNKSEHRLTMLRIAKELAKENKNEKMARVSSATSVGDVKFHCGAYKGVEPQVIEVTDVTSQFI